MTNYYESADQLIGRTPLLRARRTEEAEGLQGTLFTKLEYFNTTGSVKDRIAKAIIDAAEASGQLKPGGTIVEATSGNTGIGLASVASARGYRTIIVMPETMSVERRKLMKAYGADLELTGEGGMKTAIARADEIVAENEGYVAAHQFENMVNPQIHYETTGPEIWADTGGQVDVLVSGIGTGGTISGAGRYLREQNPEVEIIGVEPAGSPFLTTGETGTHIIQGIGAGFDPETLNNDIYNEIQTVEDEEAVQAVRDFGKNEGVFVGISAGAALVVAKRLLKDPAYEGKSIVAVLPDSGDRYLSMDGIGE